LISIEKPEPEKDQDKQVFGEQPDKVEAEVPHLNWFENVGAIYIGNQHIGTASVMNSPHNRVIMTAAHVLERHSLSSLEFRLGNQKHSLMRKFVPEEYSHPATREDFDVAFLTVEPHLGNIKGNQFGWPKIGMKVQVVGSDNNNHSISRAEIIHQSRYGKNLFFDDDGAQFLPGTSGSPWITADAHQNKWAVGNIGGYHEGGDSRDKNFHISFSSPWGSKIHEKYEEACQEEFTVSLALSETIGDGHLPTHTLKVGVAHEAAISAKQKIGCRYRYGAQGPNEFDCSGLVLWAYRQHGVTPPRRAHEQASWGDNVGLDSSHWKEGDILCFYSGLSHVGIYLGNDQFVEAENEHTGVVERKVSGYWRNQLKVVRRFAH